MSELIHTPRSASHPLLTFLLVLTGMGLLASSAPMPVHAQDTYMVNSTADASDANPGDGTCATSGGACTLRAAIEEANTDPDRDVVDFSNIPTTGGFATISVNSQLQVLREIEIAGETAPNYPSASANGPIVKLDGSNISSSSADGIEFFNDSGGSSAGSTVRGLAIVNMPGDGIQTFENSVTIEDCFIGIDVDGETIQGNDLRGIIISANDATVSGNLVSGNGDNGISMTGDRNTVISNYIGVDYNGDAAKGNTGNGVVVRGNNNLIGNAFFFGTLTDNGNVVSANTDNGILIEGDNNQVSANEIGTSADGSSALGNGGNGIDVAGTGTGSDAAENNLIGQDAPSGGVIDGSVGADRNLISGNDKDGINLGSNSAGRASSADTLRNNVIGLNDARTAALPNGADVDVDGGIVASLTNNTVIDSNVVAGNAGQGIIIFNGTNNDIYDNVVGTNRNFATGLGNDFDGIQVKPNPSSGGEEIHVVDNIVGSNGNDGIDIRGSFHDVANNYIGVAPDSTDLGNGSEGLIIDNGAASLEDVLVGTGVNPGNGFAAGHATPAGEGNVIGFNESDGILIRGQATSLEVKTNYVGTNPDGADFGNGTSLASNGDGLRIVGAGSASTDHHVGYGEGVTINSPDPADFGQGNVIAHNSGDGISVGTDASATAVTAVTVRGNITYQNGGAQPQLGIDLGNNGISSNDAGDGDSGPNNLQNFPNIQTVSESGQQVTIDYDVPTNSSNADFSSPLKVDFYAADSEQSGEGKIYLGSQDYSTANATNVVSFDLSNFSNVDAQDYFVATVTDASGNTSEFVSSAEQLPVELATFEGTQTDASSVELRWTTASEQNNAGFRVQHKGAEDDRWQKLGFVESKADGGTTSDARTYQFSTEDLAAGTHQFRLKQIDLDGTPHTHKAIPVEVQMQQSLRLSAPAPHPVQSGATLSFAVKEKQETTLRLYNTLGQRVATLYRGTPTAGETQTVQLSASDLTSGTYFLRLRTGERTRTQRVTVVR